MNAIRIAAAAVALTGLSAAAQAVVVNIDATSSAAVTQSFDAGTYEFAVIGTSQGGQYDGWTYKTGSQYRDAFSVSYDNTTYSIDYDNGSTKFSSFATTGEALSAFATGPYSIYAGSTDGTLLYVDQTLELTFATPTIVSFSVPDNNLVDNSGGVSVSVTAAVPEPETYALLIAGLGAMGFLGRRRRAA